MKIRQVMLAKKLVGNPTETDFRIEDSELGQPGPGEFIIECEWLSLDPFVMIMLDETMAGPAADRVDQPMIGSVVGKVIKSNSDKFDIGDLVETRGFWASHFLAHEDAPKTRKVPTLSDSSHALGAAGLNGYTAHVGIIHTGKVKAGETVVISAAAGATGSIAGQIAKIRGARVVGIAGGVDKCDAVKKLGFDDCVDYRADNFAEQLKAAVPDGIDVYFENVGGDVTFTVLPLLNYRARMLMCGFISYYGHEGEEEGPDMLPAFYRHIMLKGMAILGFDSGSLITKANKIELLKWIESGEIRALQTVYEGLEQAPAGFSAMFRKNHHIGKTLVKISG